MTVYQAAQTLGLSHWYVRKLVQRGKLKGHKFGRDWTVSPASVRAYARTEHKVGRPAK